MVGFFRVSYITAALWVLHNGWHGKGFSEFPLFGWINNVLYEVKYCRILGFIFSVLKNC